MARRDATDPGERRRAVPPDTGVGVLDKAVALLAALEEAPRSAAELARTTGQHRATAHRLASALEAHGLVRRDELGRLQLGSRLVALGAAAQRGQPLQAAARPVLRWLVDTTDESAQLYVREGDRRVCIEAVESPLGLRTIVAAGASLPLDRGSAGHALLHGGRQWHMSVGEREAGVASVSAAVLDADGTVRGAVSVSGPIERTTRRPGARYGATVVEAARRIEAAAGWR